MKAFWKDFIREIQKNKGRFLSVFFIAMLGAAFFSGIRSAEGDMKASADRFFDTTAYMDLRVLSTMGLVDADIETIQQVEGIEQVIGGHTLEVLQKNGENEQVVKMIALQETVNLPMIIEGRMPQKKEEILVDQKFLEESEKELGDTIKFVSGTDTPLEEDLCQETFTIVGVATLPYYMDLSRGTGSIGDGSIDSFVMVRPEVFLSEIYTEIYIQTVGTKELDSYGTSYEKIVKNVQNQVENLEEEACQRRYEEIYLEASGSLEEAKQEVEDGERELDDARKELEDGKVQIEEARDLLKEKEEELVENEQLLAEKEKELKDGSAQLEQKQAELDAAAALMEQKEQELKVAEIQLAEKEREFVSGKETLTVKEQELQQGKEELEKQSKVLKEQKTQLEVQEEEAKSKEAFLLTGLEQIQVQRTVLEQAKEKLQQEKETLEQKKAELEAQEYPEEEKLQQITESLEMIRTQEAEQKLAEEQLIGEETQLQQGLEQIRIGLKQLEEGKKELQQGEEMIAAYRQELSLGEEELKEAKQIMDAGEQELTVAKQTLADGKNQMMQGKAQITQGQEQIAQGKRVLADGKQQLADGKKQLEEGRKTLLQAKEELDEKEEELLEGWNTYEETKEEVESKLQDAKEKIADGEEELEKLEVPEWYVWGRDKVTSTTNYGLDAERITSIGTFFPVIFFLVAVLVSLTTMTRMVEEQRQQIGTLKALGYSDGTIAMKYFTYGMLATVSGAFFGVVIGEKILPWVIMNAYGMLYTGMKEFVTPLNWNQGMLAIVASAVCTGGATLAACYRELASKPAQLMRPQAPKNGKRIFMERLPFVWKHLNFTKKSTVRNLVRYKKRFFMTVIGIGGCMGLIVVGFGLQDSITAIAKNQFVNLFTYQANVVLDNHVSEQEKKEIGEDLKQYAGIEAVLEMYCQNIELQSEKRVVDTVLEVPETLDGFEQFFDLRDRVSGEHYEFPITGAAISEKTADLLGVSVGDYLQLKKGDQIVQVEIAVIVENYVNHFLYMSSTYYEEIFGNTAAYNQFLLCYTDTSESYESVLGQQVMGYEHAAAISFTSDLILEIEDMLRSLNIVIVVLIVSAGLLAFVVLYNLNNINITERQRELATLKVLGFYDGEVASYVYRENMVLTFFGILAGAGIGAVLHQKIIRTVEVDMMMFGRNIFLGSYVSSGLITLVFALLVNGMMYYRLKKIDMIESLKSVE